jgi:RHS repeat-associated protein
VAQTLDYYPYGTQRINSGSSAEQRRFIGEEFDGDTEFSYLNARYYQGSRGQFLSQEPTFLAIGTPKLSEIIARARDMEGPYRDSESKKEIDRILLTNFLREPQLANSYSYARGNPIAMRDPNGEFGVFVQGDISGNAGLGSGFAGSGSLAGGFTIGDPFSDPIDVGGFASYGGLVGGAVHSTTLQGSVKGSNNYGVFGLSGGGSIGVTVTNATKVSDLNGPGVTTLLPSASRQFLGQNLIRVFGL